METGMERTEEQRPERSMHLQVPTGFSAESFVRPALLETVNRLLTNTPYNRMYERVEKDFLKRAIAVIELPEQVWYQLGHVRDVDLYYTHKTSTPDFDHLVGVAVNAMMLASANDFAYGDVLDMGVAGLGHDIAKSGELSHKKGKLNDSDWVTMREHPVKSRDFMVNAGITSVVTLNGIRDHHRWFDGRGYPVIPEPLTLEGTIMMDADVTDAVARGRFHRKDPAFKEGSIPHTIEEMKKHSGTQFDPAQIKIWLPYLERAL